MQHKSNKKQNIKLSFDGRNICFKSELDLENYIELNFNAIFPGLRLLGRQYTVLDRRCDLICCKKTNKQAVVIELKNQEDRYVVTQLIRYHQSLLSSKPLTEFIDYSLPIELIAISPHFHPDNYIDKEYCKVDLHIHLYKFKIEYLDSVAKFHFLDRVFDLDYPILGMTDNYSVRADDKEFIFSKPGQFYQRLITFKNHKLKSSETIQQDFLTLHNRFISQAVVKCWFSNNYRYILYGTGIGENHQKLAEINNGGQNPYIYLWLPTASRTNVKVPVARFGFVCKESQSPISIDSELEWLVCSNNNISLKDRPKSTSDGFSFNRQGMLKWCPPRNYLLQASFTSSNTLQLLMYLMRNASPPFSKEDLTWWEHNSKPTPTNLGWYVDFARCSSFRGVRNLTERKEFDPNFFRGLSAPIVDIFESTWVLIAEYKMSEEALNISLFDSLMCENTFRAARSMSGPFSSVVNFSVNEFLRRVEKLAVLQSIKCSSGLNTNNLAFPRHHKQSRLHLRRNPQKKLSSALTFKLLKCSLVVNSPA